MARGFVVTFIASLTKVESARWKDSMVRKRKTLRVCSGGSKYPATVFKTRRAAEWAVEGAIDECAAVLLYPVPRTLIAHDYRIWPVEID